MCDDAYTYTTEVLDKVKLLKPNFVVVSWGIGAGTPTDCGGDGFNATGYAEKAANYLGSGIVVGANDVGPRNYGRFLPSVYCGTSGFANANGKKAEAINPIQELVLFDLPRQQ